MDDHSDQSEITSSEEEHSDDSSPENFTDDSQESESSESNYDSSDSDDNQSLPQCWTTLIDEAMGRHEVKVESLMEEYEHQGETKPSAAKVKAHNKMLPVFRKELRKVLMEKLEWMHAMKRDPFYQKITRTRQDLLDTGEYGWKEATQVAIHKRKFLLNDLINQLDDDDVSDQDVEMH